jgi:uncharacterized alkaline shock family protein YloU
LAKEEFFMTKKNNKFSEIDSKEIQLPETTYIRDIENKVFQGIVLQCLAKIEGIGLIGGTIIDSWLGRDTEKIKGIHVEQDQDKHSVFVRVDVNIGYGVSIPEKSEEIQNNVIKEIVRYTGLHVSCVHVIFKNLIAEEEEKPRDLEIEQKEKAIEEECQGV